MRRARIVFSAMYTFENFMLMLQRGTPDAAQLAYCRNQDLFVHRPDMLTRCIAQLPARHGVALLRTSYYVQKNIEVDSHRAALASIVRHNRRVSQDEQLDSSIAMQILSDAVMAFGCHVPHQAYVSAARACIPQRRWKDAQKVVRLAQKHSQNSADLLLAAAECCAHESSWKHAEALLLQLNSYVVSLSSHPRTQSLIETDELEGSVAPSRASDTERRLQAELKLYGKGMEDEPEVVAHRQRLEYVADVLLAVLECLPWKRALKYYSVADSSSPLRQVLSFTRNQAKCLEIGSSSIPVFLLAKMPQKTAVDLLCQSATEARALSGSSTSSVSQVDFDSPQIGPSALAAILENMKTYSAAMAVLKRLSRHFHLPANDSKVHAALAAIAMRSHPPAWKECMAHTKEYMNSRKHPAPSEFALKQSNEEEDGSQHITVELASKLILALRHQRQFDDAVELLKLYIASGQRVNDAALVAAYECIAQQYEAQQNEGPRVVGWKAAIEWFNSLSSHPSTSDVLTAQSQYNVLYDPEGPTEKHKAELRIPPKVLSIMLYICILECRPRDALQLVSRARVSGDELVHAQELEAILFAMTFGRWKEIVAIFEVYLGKALYNETELSMRLPMIPFFWSALRTFGKQRFALAAIRKAFPRFAR